jgi:hypothetical protein
MEVVMNKPQVRLRTRLAVLATAGGLLAGLFPMAGPVLAAVSITPADKSISADTATEAPGTGAWTILTGPVVEEGAPADISTGTLTLTLGGDYEFRMGVPVGASFTAAAGACGLTATTPTVTATTITTTIGGTITSGANRCRLTFSGIQVRPTDGHMPNVGTLTFSGAFSGAAGTLTMIPGAPILTFTTQPSSTATAGIAFPQQPIVTSLDRFTNPRAGDSIALTIRPGTGTAGAVLTCTPSANSNATPTNSAGVAAFAGCWIDKVGTGYRLRASTATGQGSAVEDSTTISITPGAPAQIGFAVQPARGIPNIAFGAQPVVAIQDAHGNTVPTAPATTVTLTLTVNPGASTLLCAPPGLSRGTVGGLATFSGCRLNNVGVGYRITASAPGYTSVQSALFDVADRLAFTVQPAGALGGTPFTTQPQVTVRAGAVATAANDNGTVVTLAIKPGTGTPGAVLSCTDGLSRTVVAGVATWAGCSIDRSSPTGNPYVLVATSPNLTSAESATLAVGVGPASRLAFTVQPATTTVNVPFAVPVSVSITDAGGNVITTGADSIRSVTLAIGVNPGMGTLTCTGGLTRAAVAGVATFPGCSINQAGTGYTLVATSPGLTSATSTAFNVTVLPATITLVRTTGMIRHGDSVGFSVQFGAGGANRTFVLEHAFVGQPWTTIATLTTNAAGFASTTFAATRTGYYRARFAGAPDLAAANSNVLLVGVRQTITLSPGHTGVVTIARGRSITFRATVRPLRPDALPSAVRFQFFQRVGATWVLRSTRTVATDAAGVASTTFRFGVRGTWHVRAFAPRTPFNSISRPTPRVFYRVL